MSLRSVLRRLHVIDPFDVDDVERAELENMLLDHASTMNRVDATIGEGLAEAQRKLRASIENSKLFSSTAQHQAPAPPAADPPSAFFSNNHPEI